MTDWKAETIVAAWAMLPLATYALEMATAEEIIVLYVALAYLEALRIRGDSE